MYYVYVLYSETKGKYYIGQTNDVEKRLRRHNNGQENYTKTGIPWMLVHQVEVETRSAAMKLERKLKNFKAD